MNENLKRIYDHYLTIYRFHKLTAFDRKKSNIIIGGFFYFTLYAALVLSPIIFIPLFNKIFHYELEISVWWINAFFAFFYTTLLRSKIVSNRKVDELNKIYKYSAFDPNPYTNLRDLMLIDYITKIPLKHDELQNLLKETEIQVNAHKEKKLVSHPTIYVLFAFLTLIIASLFGDIDTPSKMELLQFVLFMLAMSSIIVFYKTSHRSRLIHIRKILELMILNPEYKIKEKVTN